MVSTFLWPQISVPSFAFGQSVSTLRQRQCIRAEAVLNSKVECTRKGQVCTHIRVVQCWEKDVLQSKVFL